MINMESQVLNHSNLISMIQKLDTDEQLQLIEELAIIVRDKALKKKRSIMELKGLGKELWEGIDAQKYVNMERKSWNG